MQNLYLLIFIYLLIVGLTIALTWFKTIHNTECIQCLCDLEKTKTYYCKAKKILMAIVQMKED